MAKTYVEMSYRKRKYRLNSEDILTATKTIRRKAPCPPPYNIVSKLAPDTDDDNEVPIKHPN